MKTFVTSDQHFGHKNIIKLCDRPFRSVEEMDEVLMARWNEVVGPDDLVYHLGDFCYKAGKDPGHYRKKLNGSIILIRGNHDPKLSQQRWADNGFSVVCVDHFIEESGRFVHLYHYPLRDWNGYYRNSYHLFGHSHGRTKGIGRSMDVGVDAGGNFYPYRLDALLDRLSAVDNPGISQEAREGRPEGEIKPGIHKVGERA